MRQQEPALLVGNMHILVSNDDGYTAAGIKALAQEMSRFGKVTVVAPEHNHSGSSNSLTLNKPLTVTHVEDNVYVVSGTPSDCVHMALTGLLGERPDLVVSGINCGANMGDDTMYSGTVAAAIEGYIFGIDSIAFSQTDRGWGELESAAKIAGLIVEKFTARRQPDLPAVLLNVNIPNMPFDALQGIEATRLGRRHQAENVINEINPRGMPIYWLGAAGKPRDASPGTDFYATQHGRASVTPLQIDLTDHSLISKAAEWVS